MTNDLVGQVIKGYELAEQIGRGGFGLVFRARQAVVNREVAVKIILPNYANQPTFIRRFESEAQIIARLEHPHIVPLYDYWRDPEGAYLIMRLLRGGTLKNRMNGKPLDTGFVIQVLRQLTSALALAHQNDIIHRDLKPANILLDERENAYLSDFGIAKIQDVRGTMTENREFVGSPGYVSPEWISGEPINHQTDLYSLGIMTFELLAGEHPYAENRSPVAMLNAHLHQDLPSLKEYRADLPDDVDDVLHKAAAKNPVFRFDDALEFERALRHAMGVASRPIAIEEITKDLFDDIFESDLTPLSTTAAENPYRGLRAFQEADERVFFGREHLTDRLLDRMRGGRFIAVVGPSGIGKSSVVRAGLIPALRRGEVEGSQNWFMVEMMPGQHPLEELEAGLLRVAVNPPESLLEQLRADERGLARAIKRCLPDDESIELFLFIDQFEEAFTLANNDEERDLFLKSLAAAVDDPRSRVRLVVTLRADFYDRPLMHPQYGTLMREYTEVVLPMDAEELERAIVEPAKRAGVNLESGLASAIIGDVHQEPGALPLLQYALTELYDRRIGNTLVLRAYEEIGGAMGALARRADEIYDGLNEAQQDAARQLFLRLVTLGEGTGDTRRRALLSEVVGLGDNATVMQTVIDIFGAARLLTFDRDPVTRSATVEVAHEALLREWGRLRDWLSSSREDIRQERRLASLVAEWLESEHDPSILLRGSRLDEINGWASESSLQLTAEERQFLERSLQARREQEDAERIRLEHEQALERQSRDRLRAAAIVFAVATVVVGVLAFSFFQQRNDARDARTEADYARQTSDANVILLENQVIETERRSEQVLSLSLMSNGQSAMLDAQPDLALALAVRAAQMENADPEVERFLATFANEPGTRRVLGGQNAPIQQVALVNDGTAILSRVGSSIILWDAESGEEIRSFDAEDVTAFAVHNDELLTVSNQYEVWNIDSGEMLRQFGSESAEDVSQLVMSPDGKTFLSVSDDNILRLRDYETGALIHSLSAHTETINTVAFTPDGLLAVSGSDDDSIIIWDLEAGEGLRRIRSQTGNIDTLAISPNGENLLYTTETGDLVYVTLADLDLIHILRGHAVPPRVLRFSDDGAYAFSAGAENNVIVWDLASGTPYQRLDGHTGTINDVSLDYAHTTLATASDDGEVRVWDIAPMLKEEQRIAVDGASFSVALSPDGTMFATGTGSGLNSRNPDFIGVILWDAATGAEIKRFGGHAGGVNSLDFSPDGSRVAAADGAGNLIVHDVESGEMVFLRDDQDGRLFRAVYSPDGTSILVGGFGNDARLINAETGDIIQTYAGGHDSQVLAVAISPDGQYALTGGFDNRIVLWNLETGEEIRSYEGHSDTVSSLAFMPDGAGFLASSFDHTVTRWNIENNAAPLNRFTEHNREVMHVAISDDGLYALSTSFDGTAKVWDVENDEVLANYDPRNGVMIDAVFGDGHIYSTTSSLHVWRIAPRRTLSELLDWLRENRYIPTLSCETWAEYLVDEGC